ncbi:aarF domain containing kinase 5 isoform X1 [Leptinotarsa decemlineata]|uniref:aarF domain containing kinase 5 isoform X1 n=2 Tax=Leptinotarsa decemlineata TaxID=7539 RepID=UPI003D304802
MSRVHLWKHLTEINSCWKNFKKNNEEAKIFFRYTSLGLGLSMMATSQNPLNDGGNSGNIVANVSGGLRFLRSVKIGLHISVDYYFSMLGLDESSRNYNAMMSRIHQRAANNLLDGCLKNGGCYIKLGQGLVSMSQILPKEYILTLKRLQDKCLTRKGGELNQLFKEDFGKEPHEIFKTFNPEPLAAASIAQVYQATTKDDQKVAVKVQYIDLQKRFQSDVITVKALLKVIGFMHPNFNFAWVIGDLETTMKQELDFINEGLNSERCARDLSCFKYIHVPKVFWDYTSSRVLVTEFIDGCKISDVEELTRSSFSLVDINKKLFEAFGHQIFQTGFVHADPHPGNILIRRIKSNTELVLLDHGLYQQVSEEDRLALSYMWKAIVLNDHIAMKKYSSKLGVENYELFAEILTQAPLKTSGFKLRSKLSEKDLQIMTDFAKNKFDNVMCCLQAMPRALLLVIRNLNTIRAISHDHGNPIDRYSVLARTATKSIYTKYNSITNRILNFPLQFYFEFVLSMKRIGMWCRKKTLKILNRLGMVPDVETVLLKANLIF